MTNPTTPVAVLTKANTVTCGHPSGTVPFAESAKLVVATQPVRVVDTALPSVSGCTGSPQNDVPCKAVLTMTSAKAAKLRAGKHPVLLSTVTGTTDGVVATVKGALTVGGALQSKLSAR